MLATNFNNTSPSFTRKLSLPNNGATHNNDLALSEVMLSSDSKSIYSICVSITYKLQASATIWHPNIGHLEIAGELIVNGLTQRTLTKEQLAVIYANPDSFATVYSPATGKVSLLPKLEAAGSNDHKYLVLGNANIFVGMSKGELHAFCRTPGNKIPCTNFLVATDEDFGPKKKTGTRQGGANALKATNCDNLIVNFDEGRNYSPTSHHGKSFYEPPHVDVIVTSNGSHTLDNGIVKEFAITYRYKFPIDPDHPAWQEKPQDKEFNLKPIYELPEHEPARDGRGPDKGPKGRGSPGGPDGGSGGGTGDSGNDNTSPAGTGGTTAGFDNDVCQQGLVESYNNSNRNNPITSSPGAQKVEIGGVAIQAPPGQLKGLAPDLTDLINTGHWLVFPDKKEAGAQRTPFSDAQLQQLIRELTETIYLHNTYPFYSLHFAKDGSLYSIIHPAYQNTLVGQVISQLDYIMKGYLNGGYFDQKQLCYFADHPELWVKNRDALKPAILSMQDMVKRVKPEGNYVSLSELMEQFRINQTGVSEADRNKVQQRFQISFRIIAKQERIEHTGNAFLFEGGFDVHYSIELHEGAVDNIAAYRNSTEYKLIDLLCKHVAREIHDVLPTLPVCANYFAMLDVICGLCYYLSHLKQQERTPKLAPLATGENYRALGQMPPYPRTKLAFEEKRVKLVDFLESLPREIRKGLDQHLLTKEAITPELQSAVASAIQRNLPKETRFFPGNELDDLVKLFLRQILSYFGVLKTLFASSEHVEIEAKLKQNLQTEKENVREFSSALAKLEKSLSESLNTIRERELQNLRENLGPLEKSRSDAKAELYNQSGRAEKRIEIENQVPYGMRIQYNGRTYDHNHSYDLKRAMQIELTENIRKNTNLIDEKFQKLQRDIHNQVETHWDKIRREINDEVSGKKRKIKDYLDESKKEAQQRETQLQAFSETRRRLTDSPTSSLAHTSKLGLNEEFELNLPVTTRSLLDMFGEDEKSLIHIHGGTGFSLKDLSVQENSPVLRAALPALKVKQLALVKDRLGSDVQRRPVQATTVESGPKEQWETLSLAGQIYHAVYVDNNAVSTGNRQALKRPQMAQTVHEQQLLRLAALPPDKKLTTDELTFLRKFFADATSQANSKTKMLALRAANLTDAQGNSPLHLAVIQDNTELCKRLLAHGASAFLLNQYGNSPLHLAAICGRSHLIKLILNQQPKAFAVLTHNRESVLCMAVLHHQLATVKQLVETCDADVNEIGINGVPLIYTALYQGAFDIVHYLLSVSRVQCQFQLENGNTLLHLAAQMGDEAIMESLLQRGVDPHVQNRKGKNALHQAAVKGNIAAVMCLISHRPELLNSKDAAGMTALYLALDNHHTGLSQQLIDKGSDLTLQVSGGDAYSRAIRTCNSFLIQQITETLLHQGQLHAHSLSAQKRINLQHICTLRYWDCYRLLIKSDPRFLTLKLADETDQQKDTAQCFIDYVFQADAYTLIKPILEDRHTGAIATQYVQQQLPHLYRLALRHRSQGVMLALELRKFVMPYGFHDQPFHPFSVQNASHAATLSEEPDRYKDYTLLQYVVRHGLTSLYKTYFSQENADLSPVTEDGKNLLYLAAESGNLELMLQLLRMGVKLASPNGRYLYFALVEQGHAEIFHPLLVKAPLGSLIDINAPIDLAQKQSALQLACALGNMDTALALNKVGAKFDHPDADGLLPLQHAMLNNAFHLMRFIPSYPHQLERLEQFAVFAIKKFKFEAIHHLFKHYPGFIPNLLQPTDLIGDRKSRRSAQEVSAALWEATISSGNYGAAEYLVHALNLPVNVGLVRDAITHNRPKILALLLKQSLNVNEADAVGETPLHIACRLGREDCIRELLKDATIQPELRNHEGKRAQDLSKHWIKEVVLVPVKQKTILQSLLNTLKTGQLDDFKNLIREFQIPPDARLPYTVDTTVQILSVLEIAVLKKNEEAVHYLMQQSTCNPYLVNASGLTAMHLLLKSTDAQFVAEIFNDYRIDITRTPNENGCSLLHAAVLYDNPAMISYLIDRGADIYAEMNDGSHAMQLAVDDRSASLVELLVDKHDYSLSHRDSQGYSAVGLAARKGSLELVQYLAKAGADLTTTQGYKGRNLLHLATVSGNTELVFYLLTRGLNNLQRDQTGVLPIHLAAKNGHREILEMLRGLNDMLLGAEDHRGRDILDFALIHRQTELSAYLSQEYDTIKLNTTYEKAVRYKTYQSEGLSQLDLAIFSGDLTTISKLLVSANRQDQDQIKHSIMRAATSPKPDVLPMVLHHLWDKKDLEPLREALMMAIVNDQINNLKLLLPMLAPIADYLTFEDGGTPITVAAQYYAHQCLSALLDYYAEHELPVSASESFNALASSVPHQDLAFTQKLLSVSPESLLDKVDSSGGNLLHHAVIQKQPALLACFLQWGVEDRTNHNKQTALQLARATAQPACIDYLAKAKEPEKSLFAALQASPVDYDQLQWLAGFTRQGHSFNQQGQTPLGVAVSKADLIAVQTLLDQGVDPLASIDGRPNALDAATKTKNQDLIYLLLSELTKHQETGRLIGAYLKAPYLDLKEIIGWVKHFGLYDSLTSDSFYKRLDQVTLNRYASCLYVEHWHLKDAYGSNFVHRLVENHDNALMDLFCHEENRLAIYQVAALNTVNLSGHTPMELAILQGKMDSVVKLSALMSKNETQLRAVARKGGMPLAVFALVNKQEDIFRWLAKNHDVNFGDALRNTPHSQLVRLWGQQTLTDKVKQRLISSTDLSDFLVRAHPVALSDLRDASVEMLTAWVAKKGSLDPVPDLVGALWHVTHQDTPEKLIQLINSDLHSKQSVHYIKLAQTLFPSHSLMIEAYQTSDRHLFIRLLELNVSAYASLPYSFSVGAHPFAPAFKTWQRNMHQHMLTYIGSAGRNLPDYKNKAVLTDLLDRLLTKIAPQYHGVSQDHTAWIYLHLLIEQGLLALENKTPARFRTDLELHFVSNVEQRSMITRVFSSAYMLDLVTQITKRQEEHNNAFMARFYRLFNIKEEYAE